MNEQPEDWRLRLSSFDMMARAVFDSINQGRWADAAVQTRALREAIARCQHRNGFAINHDMSDAVQ